MKKIIFLIAVTNFLVIGCGGGGDSSNNNHNVPSNTTYTCAVTANSKIFFNVELGTPNYEKESGIDLVRYFFPKETNHPTQVTDSKIGENEEVQNNYILREAKAYFFGRGGAYEFKNSKEFKMQSYIVPSPPKWYLLGEDSKKYMYSKAGDNDKAWQFYTSISALMYGIHDTDFVKFADVGDTVLSSNIVSEDVNMTIAKNCTLVSTAPSKEIGTIEYDDVIELSCTIASTIGKTFTGQKLKLLLAKDVGIVSQTEDIYITVIKNTQETNRQCTHSLTEITSTQIVQRANVSE